MEIKVTQKINMGGVVLQLYKRTNRNNRASIILIELIKNDWLAVVIPGLRILVALSLFGVLV
jgi:hypothetical protein